jgi:hypothetical protein
MSKNDNIDEELFLQLKNMYNKNYINPEEFKQIIIKYKDLKNQTKWSFEQEQILSEISEKSSLYHWLHRASYDYYIKQDNLFVYPLAIINGISSMFTLIGVTYEEKIDPKVLALVSGTINLATGILTGIYKKMNYNAIIEGHRKTSENFSRISRNISNQLSLRPSERERMPKYFHNKMDDYEKILDSAPILSNKILKKFSRKFKNVDTKKPTEISGIDKCRIYKGPDNESDNENDNENDTNLIPILNPNTNTDNQSIQGNGVVEGNGGVDGEQDLDNNNEGQNEPLV